MEIKCSGCGKIITEYDGVAYNVGTRVQWLCFECHKQGQREAVACEVRRVKRSRCEEWKRSKK